VEDAAIVLATAGAALLVVLGGSPWWRLVRLGAVLSVGLMIATARGTGTVRTRAAVVAVAGAVAAAAGAGVGIPYAVKSGVAWETVAGLLTLLAGVTLLGRALVDAVRLLRGWRKVMVLPVAWVLLQFGVVPVAAAVAATNVPPTQVGTRRRPTAGCATSTRRSAPVTACGSPGGTCRRATAPRSCSRTVPDRRVPRCSTTRR
jgi:hypothetical protein